MRGGRGKEERCLGKGGRTKKRRHEPFTGEFRLGLVLVLTSWHQRDMRQHTLSSSFIIHTVTMRYEVSVESQNAKLGLMKLAVWNP